MQAELDRKLTHRLVWANGVTGLELLSEDLKFVRIAGGDCRLASLMAPWLSLTTANVERLRKK